MSDVDCWLISDGPEPELITPLANPAPEPLTTDR